VALKPSFDVLRLDRASVTERLAMCM